MASTGATVSQGSTAPVGGSQQQSQSGQGSQTTQPKSGSSKQSVGNPLTQAASEVQNQVDASTGDEIETEVNEGNEGLDADGGEPELDADGKPKPKEKKLKPGEIDPEGKFKIKVKGQEVEINGDQLKKLAEQGGRMYQAMEEAAKFRKENETLQSQTKDFSNLFQAVKTDAQNWLELGRSLGHDVEKIAHDIVLERMKYEGMDETGRKLHDTQKKLKDFETREAKDKAEFEARQKAARVEAYAQHSKQEVFDFFSQKFGNKPPLQLLEYTLANIISSFDNSGQNGGSRMPIAKAFELAQNQLKANKQRTLYEVSDEDLNSLPDDHPLMIKARQRAIQKFKQQSRQSGTPERTIQQPSANQPAKRKTLTIDEYFALKDKQYGST